MKFNKPVKDINDALLQQDIIGGFDLSEVSKDYENQMLVAVTELRTKDEIDTFVKKAGELNGSK